MVHSSLQLCSFTFLRHVHAAPSTRTFTRWGGHLNASVTFCTLTWHTLFRKWTHQVLFVYRHILPDGVVQIPLALHVQSFWLDLGGHVIFGQNGGIIFHQVLKQCFCVTVLLQLNTSWVVLEVGVVMYLYVVHFLEILSQKGWPVMHRNQHSAIFMSKKTRNIDS